MNPRKYRLIDTALIAFLWVIALGEMAVLAWYVATQHVDWPTLTIAILAVLYCTGMAIKNTVDL